MGVYTCIVITVARFHTNQSLSTDHWIQVYDHNSLTYLMRLLLLNNQPSIGNHMNIS